MQFSSVYPKATLIIRSCPMEFKTIYANVQQIVRQLERIDSFYEILLVCDSSRTKNFNRSYGNGDVDLRMYFFAVSRLETEGVVDRVANFGNIACG